MLSFAGPIVSAVAKRELRQTARFATQADPTPALTSNFLSNAPDRRLERIRSRTASLWTQTRRATKNFPITISVPDEGAATLTAPDYDEPVLAKDACRFLHNITRDSAAAKLRLALYRPSPPQLPANKCCQEPLV